MPAISVAQQAKAYGNFYVPRFEIRASAVAANQGLIRDVTQVTYKDDIKGIDSFDFTVGNWDTQNRRFKYVGSETTKSLSPAAPESIRYRLFEPALHDFELKLGYGSTLTSMTTGSVTTLEPLFVAGAPPTLTVRALNVLHRLRDKPHSQHWEKKKESEIAETIKTLTDPATKRKLSVRTSDKIKSKEQPLDYVAQDNQTDIDFLFSRARLAGYVVYAGIDAPPHGKIVQYLYFGPSDDRHPGVQDVTYELEWGISLNEFKPVLATANQLNSVEVRSRDPKSTTPLSATVDLNDPELKINADLVAILTKPGAPVRSEVITNEPQPSLRQATRRARAILSDRLKEMVTAHATTIGLPDLRSGQRVRIKGVGSRFSGVYFVTETTHTINDSGYSTQFTARREQPLDGGDA